MAIVWVLLVLSVAIQIEPGRAVLQSFNLNGQHLVIATVDLNPYMYIYHDADGKIDRADGVIHMMLLWCAEKYNFTFHYVEPADGLFGALINDTWVGMVGMTVKKEVDLIAAQLTTTYERSLVIDFTTSISKDPMTAVIPAPSEDSYMKAIIEPYHWKAWIVIIFSMFIGALAAWVVSVLILHILHDGSNEPHALPRFSDDLFYFFSTLSFQAGGAIPGKKFGWHAPRILIAAWILMCVIIFNTYNAELVSFITAPKLRPVIESFADLSVSTQLQLAILQDSTFETIIMEADAGPYKLLGDSLRSNPKNRLPGEFIEAPIFLKKALTKKFAMVDQKSYLESVLDLAYQQSGKCEVTMMKEEVVTTLDSLALQKHSPYTDEINKGILRMIDFGLMDYWGRRFLTKPKCADQSVFKNSFMKPRITLNNLLGPFLLLLVGIGMSVLAFLVELCSVYWKRCLCVKHFE